MLKKVVLHHNALIFIFLYEIYGKAYFYFFFQKFFARFFFGHTFSCPFSKNPGKIWNIIFSLFSLSRIKNILFSLIELKERL
jgi:hypothetical protein